MKAEPRIIQITAIHPESEWYPFEKQLRGMCLEVLDLSSITHLPEYYYAEGNIVAPIDRLKLYRSINAYPLFPRIFMYGIQYRTIQEGTWV